MAIGGLVRRFGGPALRFGPAGAGWFVAETAGSLNSGN
jgi:hypothetical protein